MDPTRINLTDRATTERFTGYTAHGSHRIDVPYMSEIREGLWQGGCRDGLLLPSWVDHLVSLYPWEKYRIKHQLRSNLQFMMYDSTVQAMHQVEELAQWVLRRWEDGSVLVHCQAGLNRSSLLVARVLMLDGASADDAINEIRTKRSPGAPAAVLCNPTFESYLRDQER